MYKYVCGGCGRNMSERRGVGGRGVMSCLLVCENVFVNMCICISMYLFQYLDILHNVRKQM